jgi:adenylosuccinate lyase
MLNLMTEVVRDLRVYPENLRRNLERTQGLIFSQDVMLALTEKGMTREEAYRLVQGHALRAWEEERPLLALLREDERVRAVLTEEELEACFRVENHLRHVDTIFARFGL